MQNPGDVRRAIRAGRHRRNTAGLARGYVQGNVCILPRDFDYCVRQMRGSWEHGFVLRTRFKRHQCGRRWRAIMAHPVIERDQDGDRSVELRVYEVTVKMER